MHRQAVQSTTMASAGYEPKRRRLEIEFCTGKIYQYLHVPERVYLELMTAESKGKYFNYHIKDRYPFIAL